MSLPVLASATYREIINIGGSGAKSALFTDQEATVPAVLGDAVRAIKSVDGVVTYSSGSGVGPVYTTAPLFGGRKVLFAHDYRSGTTMTSSGFARNVGAAGSYVVVCAGITPSAWSSSSSAHRQLADFAGSVGVFFRRGATNMMASFQSSSWNSGTTTLGFSTPYVMAWEFFNDGSQKVRPWLNGVPEKAAVVDGYATNLTSMNVFWRSSDLSRMLGAVGWLGFIEGTMSQSEHEAMAAALIADFDFKPGGTRTVLGGWVLPNSAQGYTRDSQGNQYTTTDGQIRKFDAANNLLLQKTSDFYPIVGQNGTGGCAHHNGLIYVCQDGPSAGQNTTLSWYSAETLERVGHVVIERDPWVSGMGASCAVDPKRNRLYVAVWQAPATQLFSYDLTTKAFVEVLPLDAMSTTQGIAVQGNYVYFSGGNSIIHRVHLDNPSQKELVANLAGAFGESSGHISDMEMSAHNGTELRKMYIAWSNTSGTHTHLLVELGLGQGLNYEPSTAVGERNRMPAGRRGRTAWDLIGRRY